MFNFFKPSYPIGCVEELETELKALRAEKERLEADIRKLKLEYKIKEEDVMHMVKLKEEKNELEFQRKIMKYEADKQKEISIIKREYADKIEKQLQKEAENIKTMYDQILSRLPNVNVMLGNADPSKDSKK